MRLQIIKYDTVNCVISILDLMYIIQKPGNGMFFILDLQPFRAKNKGNSCFRIEYQKKSFVLMW